MRVLRRLLARIRNRHFHDDLVEELRFHEDMKRRELEASGLPAAEAGSLARKSLGNTTLMRENSRGVWIAPWLDSVAQDVRYAIRSLAQHPTHSITALLALTLAIGLNTSFFTVFKALVLTPWPINDPGSVFQISAREKTGSRRVEITGDEVRFLREQAKSLTGLSMHTFPGNRTSIGSTPGEGPSLLTIWASSNFLDVLGVRMQIGGGFVPEDDQPANPRAPVILSNVAWRNHFAADPSVIGRAIKVGGKAMTVVGVTEPSFDGIGREVDLWLPLSALKMMGVVQSTGVTGRLARGVSPARARQELQLLHDRFATSNNREAHIISLATTAEVNANNNKYALLGALSAAVILILVLACSNVGNLQLARGLARRREIATRLSIGASRARIIRQLLTEGLVLAIASGAVAIGIAAVLPTLLIHFAGEDVPPYMSARFAPDAQVLSFSLAVSVLACLFFALAPALRATRSTIPVSSLERASTRSTRIPLRTVFLATQVAMCTVLLIGAGLLTRAVTHAMTFDPGFRTDGITMISASLPSQGTTRAQQIAYANQLRAQLEEDLKDAIAVATPTPLQLRLGASIRLPGQRETRFPMTAATSPSYFDLLGIQLVIGRLFDRQSTDEAVVNETFARTLLHSNPLGQVVQRVERDGTSRGSFTIVGVVRDAYLSRLDGIDPMIFTPATTGTFMTRGDAATVERIRATALGINPAARVSTSTIADNVHRRLEESRTGATLAWGVGLLGLTLAAVGVFGVFAYAVEERRREIGLRIALGARRSEIVRLLATTSGRAMLFGLAAGLLLSLGCGPVLESFLYGLTPLDPGTYGFVSILLVCAGIAATLIPARRACRVDPALTLREE